MKCESITSGKQCKARAMKADRFCFRHSPRTIEERASASSRGGLSHARNLSPLPEIPIESPRDIVLLLATMINEVRKGEVDMRVANTFGYLSGHLLKALETADLEKRVEELESTILARGGRGSADAQYGKPIT